jgi:hypothetical protein
MNNGSSSDSNMSSTTADGLFIGQPKEFNQPLLDLAAEADQAKREG